MNYISHAQRKKIFLLAAKANLSSEQLHDYLPTWCGASSLSGDSMSSSQADTVIKSLNKILGIDVPPLRKGGRGVYQSTNNQQPTTSNWIFPSQISAVNKLTKSLGWSESRLDGFILRTIGFSIRLDKLSKQQGTYLIIGLKKFKTYLSKQKERKN